MEGKKLEPKHLPLLLVAATLGFAAGGLILWLYWGWFLAPLGADAISLPHAIGLRLMVSVVLAFWSERSANKRNIDTFEDVAGLIAGRSSLWLVLASLGWAMSLWMAP